VLEWGECCALESASECDCRGSLVSPVLFDGRTLNLRWRFPENRLVSY